MDIIQVGITDDQKLFRQGLSAFVLDAPGLNLCFEATDGIDCLSQLKAGSAMPHVMLLDLEMPLMDGMETNQQLQLLYPGIKVIILSVHARERLIAKMISSGASGYLMKNCDKDELIQAIRAVYESGFYINAQVLTAIQQAAAQPAALRNTNGIVIELSARELEVLQYICREYNNAEIAERLFLSIRTVEGHRNNLLLKTGCRNTAGLVLYAVRHHLVDLPF